MQTNVSLNTPDELVEFALLRKKCFEQLKTKLHELIEHPDGMFVIISESGNYALGKDGFEAHDQFEEHYPNDEGGRSCFSIGDAR
jgi:hypothetical protein